MTAGTDSHHFVDMHEMVAIGYNEWSVTAWKDKHYHAWRLIDQSGQLGDKSGKSEVAHRQSPAGMVNA